MVQTSAALESAICSRRGLVIFWLSIALILLAASQFPVVGDEWRSGDIAPQDVQFVQPICLFVDQADYRYVAGSQTQSVATEKPETVGVLDNLANQITAGIVTSTQRRRAGFKDIPVDLQVVVDHSIDRGLANTDPYWRYYTDCDRWHVTFGGPNRATNSGFADVLRHAGRQLHQQVEFMLVETATFNPPGQASPRIELSTKNTVQAALAPWTVTHIPDVVVWQKLKAQIRGQITRIHDLQMAYRQVYNFCLDSVNMTLDTVTRDNDRSEIQ